MSYIFRLLSALLTAYYSTKLLYLAFYATPSAARVKMEAVFESGAYILLHLQFYLFLVYLVVICFVKCWLVSELTFGGCYLHVT